MVNVTYLSSVARTGNNGFPAYFDPFLDLDIHRRIQAVAERRFRSNDEPTALIESAKELFQRLRDLSGATDDVDGVSIADYALACKKWPDTQPDRPRVKLNMIDSESAWNYQKGFHELVSGISRALRNPIAHNPADRQFIQERFGDRKTALKFLCVISLILEKLEEPNQ